MGSVVLVALSVAGVLAMSGCGDEPRAVRKVEPPAALLRDVAPALRGTIGAEATFRGIEPVLVSGLGIVVGLAGTGGADNLDQAVLATMERELGRGGVGRGSIGANMPGLEGVTPQQFLRSRNVAVVIVESRIPPGAPEDEPFDVYVRAVPGSSVTSLEGGTLWTTDLRIGPAAVFGSYKTRRIAEARGPIFINPFSAPSTSATGELEVTRTTGRILGGGKVVDPLLIEMVLDNDSHARARSIVGAINSRFARGAGDEGQIARGRGSGGGASMQSVALRVPRSYRERPAEFLQLVRHLRVDPSVPEEFARQYVETLKTQPELSEDMRWCLQAVGRPALPFLYPMYDYPELGPRMAALQAGAGLGDPRAVPALIELAKTGPASLRTEAIDLLGRMPSNPAVNLALRELLSAPELDVRISAYESLRERGDSMIVSVPVGDDVRQPKFLLELVQASDPLVYVTQQGQPRVVIFGGIDASLARTRPDAKSGKYRGLAVTKPNLVSLWDDRFMMAADESTSPTRVMWRDARGKLTQTTAPDEVAELVQFLAHNSTPENPRPGLGMSYSQVVGAVYEMTKRGAIGATFATEEDKLRAEIFQAAQQLVLVDRPETEADAQALKGAESIFKPEAPKALAADGAGGGETAGGKSKIVPLKRKNAK
ncbi:MAG: flagellar basal body P-ring protein FlgI [Phycisphaerales bacterium]|nr:flagellar basal body P-ring protein FlgI [Phycisphaerales bacterium]